jgi:hypothetical protein
MSPRLPACWASTRGKRPWSAGSSGDGALWRVQGHAAVVHTVLTATERRLFGTDAAMHAS